jgi:hypothetical protein
VDEGNPTERMRQPRWHSRRNGADPGPPATGGLVQMIWALHHSACRTRGLRVLTLSRAALRDGLFLRRHWTTSRRPHAPMGFNTGGTDEFHQRLAPAWITASRRVLFGAPNSLGDVPHVRHTTPTAHHCNRTWPISQASRRRRESALSSLAFMARCTRSSFTSMCCAHSRSVSSIRTFAISIGCASCCLRV